MVAPENKYDDVLVEPMYLMRKLATALRSKAAEQCLCSLCRLFWPNRNKVLAGRVAERLFPGFVSLNSKVVRGAGRDNHPFIKRVQFRYRPQI